ncbi:hypothetical protein BGX26_007211 [Mortierella sp. AD094]|nr:hypothetical protein BGX26_007211 [Mortierella sp. AD094]
MSQEELLQRLEYMTTVVFPAIKKRSLATQKRMIERFNATILQNEFPDGAKEANSFHDMKDRMRHYAPSQLKLVLDFEDTSTYEVEKITDRRPSNLKPNAVEYFVKWKNYSSKQNTWEPEEHFIERQRVTDYWIDYYAQNRQMEMQTREMEMQAREIEVQAREMKMHTRLA